MVKNRAELIRMANEWMSFAKSDLSSQIVAFMESVGSDINELANVLAITPEELESIIEQRGEIKLSTFAKLLIATDHVVEIKPLSQVLINGKKMPKQLRSAKRNCVGAPIMPPNDRDGRVPKNAPSNMPPFMSGMPMNFPPFGYPNPMEMNEKVNEPILDDNPNAKLDRRSLVQSIINNGWENEIDLVNATEDELAKFVNTKEYATDVQADSEYEKIMGKISNELKRNPHLMQQLKNIMCEH